MRPKYSLIIFIISLVVFLGAQAVRIFDSVQASSNIEALPTEVVLVTDDEAIAPELALFPANDPSAAAIEADEALVVASFVEDDSSNRAPVASISTIETTQLDEAAESQAIPIALNNSTRPNNNDMLSDTDSSDTLSEASTVLRGGLGLIHGDDFESGIYYSVPTLTTETGEVYELMVNAKQVEPYIGQQVEVTGQFLSLTSNLADNRSVLAVGNITSKPTNIAHPLNATPSIAGSQPWVNILCKFGDNPSEPRTPTWVDNMFTDALGGLNHYWQTLSYGNIDIYGTATINQWVTLPEPRSYYVPPGQNANLSVLLNDCVDAADHLVNYPQYIGINMFFNDYLGCCAWGGNTFLSLDGVSKSYRVTWLPTWAHTYATIGHEMGHGFNMPHSSGPVDNPPVGLNIYISQWDVMSLGTVSSNQCDPSTWSADYQCAPFGTIGHNIWRSGWLTNNQVVTVALDETKTIDLERLVAPTETNKPLVVIVPIGNSTQQYYTIEVRDQNNYDLNVPGKAVLIHHIDLTRRGNTGPALVVDSEVGLNTSVNDEGAMWRSGESFVDATYHITINILNESDSSFTVEVINGDPVFINDEPTSPIDIDPLPYTNYQSMSDATGNVTDPASTCGTYDHSVWYQYTSDVDRYIAVDTFGTNFDTLLGVYEGTPDMLTEVVCNDDMQGTQSEVSWQAIGGTTYYVLVGFTSDPADPTLQLNAREIMPPDNNNAASPIIINGLPYQTEQSTATALYDAAADPTPTCWMTYDRSVWYQYTPSSTQDITIDTFGSGYNTLLAVYTGAPNSLTELLCNTDHSATNQSKVSFEAQGNTTYYIMIGRELSTLGTPTIGDTNHNLHLSVREVSNDDADTPYDILTVPYTITQSIADATRDRRDPISACAASDRNVWYRYTSPISQGIIIDTIGSDYDTVVSVYTGTPSGFTEALCNGNAANNIVTSEVSWQADRNVTYYIAVASRNGAVGNLNLNVTNIPPRSCNLEAFISDLEAANANPDTTTIDLNSNCVFTLSEPYLMYGDHGLPAITSPIVINGNYAIIERSLAPGTPNFGLFYVASGGSLSLNDITLQYGDQGETRNGGAIRNAGEAILNNVVIEDNHAKQGAAIYSANNAILDISRSRFERNIARSGGAIFTRNAPIYVRTTTFLDNTAYHRGGAIAYFFDNIAFDLSISDSTFEKNQAGYGGAIHFETQIANRISFNMFDTIFTDNAAVTNVDSNAGQGGAIDIYLADNTNTAINLYEAVFLYNSAITQGGAINIFGGDNTESLLYLSANYLRWNSAANGGALASDHANVGMIGSEFYNNVAYRMGGAIHTSHDATILDIASSTLSYNQSGEGGGAVNSANLQVNFSTFFGNTTTNTTSYGGAIRTYGADASITNSRLISNFSFYESGALYVDGDASVENSCFYNNSYLAVTTTGTIDAINNWWGAANGPSGFGTGVGDSVGNNVLYEPFLLSDNFTCGGTTQIISGFVVDEETGIPIENAIVEWFVDESSAPATTTTGSRGEYTLLNAPLDSPILVRAYAPTYGIEFFNEAITASDAELLLLTNEEPDAVNVNFTLTSKATITGTVYAADGTTSLPDVPIVVNGWPEWDTLCTDENGQYTLDNLTSGQEYRIAAGGSSAQCTDASHVQIWWENEALITNADALLVPNGGLTDVDFILDSDLVDPVAEITFTLVDLDGREGIVTGENFDIEVRGRDLINDNALYAAYMDIGFYADILVVEEITYNDPYTLELLGTFSAGSVSNVGATANSQTPPADDLIFTLHMRAIAASQPDDPVTLVGIPASELASNITMYGESLDLRPFTHFEPLAFLVKEPAPRPIFTHFDIVNDHTVGATADVTFTVANEGTAAAATLDLEVIFSSDDTAGNGDDVVIDTLTLENIAIDESRQHTATLALDGALLYGLINSEDTSNLGDDHTSTNAEYLYIKVAGADTPTLTEGINQDDFTLFPWNTGTTDTTPNSLVDPLDAMFVINRIGQTIPPADGRADADQSGGSIDTDDVLSILTRLGYEINHDVFEGDTPTSTLPRIPSNDLVAEIRVEIVDLNGQAGFEPNEAFEVEIHAVDVRNRATPQSVFAAYTDIEFDPSHVRLDNMVIHPNYTYGQDHTIGAGYLNNVGGISDVFTPSSDTLLFTLEMTTLQDGTSRIRASRSDEMLSTVVVFNEEVDQRYNTNYHEATIEVTSPPTPTPPPVANTVGVYYPASSLWTFRDTASEGDADIRFYFGNRALRWSPVVGDWDGDGVDGIGLYKDGMWYLRETLSTGTTERRIVFGSREAGWLPVVGDWDGDGVDGIGLYKDGHWILRQTATSGGVDIRFRFDPVDGGIPVAGDWFDDAYDTVGIHHEGVFYLRRTNDAQSGMLRAVYGPQSDDWYPVTGDWDADGRDTIGVFSAGLWRLRNDNTNGTTDLGFRFGSIGIPLTRYTGGMAALNALAQTPIIIETDTPTPEPPETSTPTPEITAETSPSATPEPEITAETTPSATPPEVPETTSEPEVTPEATPSVTPTSEATEAVIVPELTADTEVTAEVSGSLTPNFEATDTTEAAPTETPTLPAGATPEGETTAEANN